MAEVLKPRIIYRSRGISYSLVAALEDCAAWARNDLDPGEIRYVEQAAAGDRMLEAGEVDFIFGSHVTPYIRYADGVRFTYLGQSVNWCDDVLVTQAPVSSVAELRGRRVTERLTRESHSRGNRVLLLRRAGVAENEVTWVDRGSRKGLELVAAGEADAVFVSPLEAARAPAMGLRVHTPPPLPMVVASTMTTLWPVVRDQPELCRRVLRAVRMGIRHFKSEPKAMARVMAGRVAPELGIDDQAVLDMLYQRNARLLEASLYPRAEAVSNAFALAIRQSPGLEGKVTPMQLWDMHFLRELDAQDAA
jgi:hypothetical protein